MNSIARHDRCLGSSCSDGCPQNGDEAAREARALLEIHLLRTAVTGGEPLDFVFPDRFLLKKMLVLSFCTPLRTDSFSALQSCSVPFRHTICRPRLGVDQSHDHLYHRFLLNSLQMDFVLHHHCILPNCLRMDFILHHLALSSLVNHPCAKKKS
jgi:hypothetical protein